MKYVFLLFLIFISCNTNENIYVPTPQREIPQRCLIFDDYDVRAGDLLPNDTSYIDKLANLNAPIKDRKEIMNLYERCCGLAWSGKLSEEKYRDLINNADLILNKLDQLAKKSGLAGGVKALGNDYPIRVVLFALQQQRWTLRWGISAQQAPKKNGDC